MSTPSKSSLTKRLPRHRLWFAGAGAAAIAVVAGWMMLNTNPGNALMLPAAVVGVDKAKSRLALAQMAEKRQRDLQAIRGGALKDLEQAQSDLVQAQGDLRAAEISLAAVRNRLRILGRSDEEIADLEKRDRV